jgi:hypothetical protein
MRLPFCERLSQLDHVEYTQGRLEVLPLPTLPRRWLTGTLLGNWILWLLMNLAPALEILLRLVRLDRITKLKVKRTCAAKLFSSWNERSAEEHQCNVMFNLCFWMTHLVSRFGTMVMVKRFSQSLCSSPHVCYGTLPRRYPSLPCAVTPRTYQ